jgi:hypothetical protein
MTQHILMIWIATAVATFSGLVGCTGSGAASARAAARAVHVPRMQVDFLDNMLRAVGWPPSVDEARGSFKLGGLIEHTTAFEIASAAQSGTEFKAAHARIEFDAWPGRIFAGHVSNISSVADSGTGTVTVEVQV